MRQIQCPDCANRFLAKAKEFNEPYRRASGKAIIECVCDSCNKEINKGDLIIAITMHPQGPDVVCPWEHEYLE